MKLQEESDARIAELERQMDAERQELATKLQQRDRAIQDAEARVHSLRTRLDQWKQRTVATGLVAMDVQGVCQVLQFWGVRVPTQVLEQHDVTGQVLAVLTEAEMATELGIDRLGDRRRLTLAVQRLRDGLGLDRPEYAAEHPGNWSCEQVKGWLRRQGAAVAHHQRCFVDHAIDGEVLLTLTRDDLQTMGVASLGERVRIDNILAAVRPQRPAPPPSTAAAAAAAAAPPEEDEDVVPEFYRCPITRDLMQDPVILVDSGHTFERAALEQWLNAHNTNPLTGARLVSAATAPNFSLRHAIQAFLESRSAVAAPCNYLVPFQELHLGAG